MAIRTCMLAAAAAAACAADSVAVRVGDPIANLPALPSNFASFSYEVSCIPGMFTHNSQPRTSFINLMNVLKSAGNKGQPGATGPNIRIGGNSADTSAYLPASVPLPTNISYRITDADFQAYAAVVHQWNGTISPGVNFRYVTANGDANSSLATAHIQALTKYVPFTDPIFEAVEIGNENDLYHDNGIRTPKFTAAQYVTQWGQMVSALANQAGLPAQKIQGATWCCGSDNFNDVLTQYIEDGAAAKLLGSMSYHQYPLNVCNHKDDLTVYQLLANNASDTAPARLAPFIQTSLANDIPFYIGEGNSIACGGQANVSDVFASTLWALDSMLAMATVGVTRWNFHGCTEGAYTAIAYDTTKGSPDTPAVRPLFYAMWAMNTIAARNARVVTDYVTTSNPLIRVWTVVDADGKTRVTVIHKDPSASDVATVTVTPASGSAASTATLARLQPAAGGVFAKTGLTFAGQTFDGSGDGLPVGTFSPVQVQASNGLFTFTVQQASIAILEF